MTTSALPHEYAPTERAALDVPSRFDRACFVSGIVSSLLFLVGTALFIAVIVPRLPAMTASSAERALFYAEMSRNAVYRSISYLGELQLALLLLFFGGLFGMLRRAERGTGALSFAIFGAGIALAVISPLTILIEDHLMLGLAAAKADSVIVASMDGLGPLSFALGGFPQALILGGTAALLKREQIVSRWVLWFGVVVAVLSLAGTGTLMRGAMFPISSLAMILFRIWLLALAIALVWHARSVVSR